jgi:signal transduction histidine kinase
VLGLDICDAGGARNGASVGATTGGHGIVGMRECAALFGGELTAVPTADGFRVTATLPLPLGGGQ